MKGCKVPAGGSVTQGVGLHFDSSGSRLKWLLTTNGETRYLGSVTATVTEFNYKNPHPTMTFERRTKDGKTEQWVSELLTNPAVLARAGWTRTRSVEALAPGTRVKLYLGTSRAGGHSAIVMKIESERGENIVGDRADVTAVADLDGVPDGMQPKTKAPLPGQLTGSGQ